MNSIKNHQAAIFLKFGVKFASVFLFLFIFNILLVYAWVDDTGLTVACADGVTLSSSESHAALAVGLIQISMVKSADASHVETTIDNNTVCAFPVSVLSYKVYDAGTFTQKIISNSGVVVIPANSSHVFTSDIADCLTQVDAFYGQGPTDFSTLETGPDNFGGTIFDTNGSTFTDITAVTGNFCTDVIPPPPPPPPTTGTLIVTKIVSGGTAATSSFALFVDSFSVTTGVATTTNLGAHMVSETPTTNYTGTFGGDCDSNGNVTVGTTTPATCTLTNTFVPPPSTPTTGSLIVTKIVSGGTAATSSFALFVDGFSVTSGVATTTSLGAHMVSETSTTTYTGVFSGDCDSNGNVNVGTTTTAHCTLTNTFATSTPPVIPSTPPPPPPTSHGGGGHSQYSFNALCVANQTSAYIGDTVTWSATGVTGGNGVYTYSWTGTEGLSGNNYFVNKIYNDIGTKYAYLTVYSNGQSITRTCSLYVNNRNGQVLAFSSFQTPQNGVLLTDVPYTGVDSSMKINLFILALVFWSAVLSYFFIIRKRSELIPAAVNTTTLESMPGNDQTQQSVRQEILMGHDNMLSSLESFARNQNIIISGDALAAVVDIAGDNQKRAETLLGSLASQYTTNSEWVTLDLSKVDGR